jgi:DNA repair protein RecO (recombination protein O)
VNKRSTEWSERAVAVSLRDKIYRTDAVVLSRMDFGEADRILTVYSPTHGKLRVIAKGTRRPTSRLLPHLEYFTRVRLMLAKGRELDVVTGAETLDRYLPLRDRLDAYAHASHLAELLLRFTQDRQENPAIYDLLVGSLRLLADGVDPFAVTRHFEMAFLTLVGFKPELYRCVSCQAEIQAMPNPFSIRLGGLLCPVCRPNDLGARPLSINAQKYLRTLDRSGLAPAIRLPLDDELRQELEGTLGGYLRHVAEREFHSLRVWHDMSDRLDASR